jgi:hypothetical protein
MATGSRKKVQKCEIMVNFPRKTVSPLVLKNRHRKSIYIENFVLSIILLESMLKLQKSWEICDHHGLYISILAK